MTKAIPWHLNLMFASSAAIVLVLAYRYLRPYPAGAVIFGVAGLAILSRWYWLARQAGGQVPDRTAQKLALFMLVLLLVLPYLLRTALAR